MIEICPTRYELYDEMGVPIGRIKMFDDTCADIKLESTIDPKTWEEIDMAVRDVLAKMFPNTHGGSE